MRALILATTLILGVAGTAVAQDKAHVTTPDSIQWGPAPPALPKGAQMTVLAGDPGKAGPFTVRLKTPASAARTAINAAWSRMSKPHCRPRLIGSLRRMPP